MINSLYIYRTADTDPFRNLAREQIMLENGPDDGVILYLWQNKNTVVIGRNQNAFKECRVSLLNEEGGLLARRLSGGGAVFHDMGNLNFTFILPRGDFDIRRQFDVICRACRSFGINAGISGRNDLEADGQKFSGSAFYKSGKRAYHHGTLLMNADMNLLGRYLSPPTAKLKAKGVDSVKSRVINLCSLAPGLTCDALCKALIREAEAVYKSRAQEFVFTPYINSETDRLRKHYESREWRFGSDTPASFVCEETFSWGTVTLNLNVAGGIITSSKLFTDSMDWELSAKIQSALSGAEFSKDAMCSRLADAQIEPGIKEDLLQMIKKQEL